MLEELKQLIELIKGMPHMVMWVLAGLLFYKVVIIGSWFSYDLGRHFITTDGTFDSFLAIIGALKKDNSPYIHQSDVAWFRVAVYEKKQRDRENKNTKLVTP